MSEVGICKRLWNWCRRPPTPTSTFARFATPLYVSILIGGFLLAVLVAVISGPSGFRLFSIVDESGRATEVMERVLFPGGAIVVYKHPVEYPHPTWYVSVKIHNYITSEEDLLTYANSRTDALNELLNLLSVDRKVEITVTFKEALEPSEFKDLYGDYLAESEGSHHSAIIVENETSGNLERIILSAPSPDYLEQWLTYPKEGLKMIGVISFEAFLKVNMVKSLTQDPRILLVDPQTCPIVCELVEKYGLMGFDVTVDRPPIVASVFEPELTWGATPLENLLANPSKFNRWRLYFIGKVSDLSLVENAFFTLDEKLLVYYEYYEIDLSEQIDAENIKNGEYAKVVGTFFQERSTLYADEIKKADYSRPEELLSITLDKKIYNQGDNVNITIKNISDRTTWFGDTAYNLCFEKFNGVDWELHTQMAGGLARTPLEPGQTAHITWKLGAPFSPGHYRVGTYGVYVDFDVT